MGKKFTDGDLFRIARDNLSAKDEVSFQFTCATLGFRESVSQVAGDDIRLSTDERNLLERLIRKIKFIRGGR